MLSPLRRLILCSADGSRPIPRLVGSTMVFPPYSTKWLSSSIAALTSSNPQLSRLRNGFIRKSPIIEMSSALSAIAISEPQHGRFHQLEASSKTCSCNSVTPIASTGMGPSTVRTSPECTPIVGFAMFSPSSSARPSSCAEQPEIEPNRDQNDEALNDRRYERRHMVEDEAVADDRNGQGAQHRAEHRAAPPEQTRSTEHDRRDDLEFEPSAGV